MFSTISHVTDLPSSLLLLSIKNCHSENAPLSQCELLALCLHWLHESPAMVHWLHESPVMVTQLGLLSEGTLERDLHNQTRETACMTVAMKNE